TGGRERAPGNRWRRGRWVRGPGRRGLRVGGRQPPRLRLAPGGGRMCRARFGLRPLPPEAPAGKGADRSGRFRSCPQIFDERGAFTLPDSGVLATDLPGGEIDPPARSAPEDDDVFVEQELLPRIRTFHDHQGEHAPTPPVSCPLVSEERKADGNYSNHDRPSTQAVGQARPARL